MDEMLHLSLPHKGDFGITKNYRARTPTAQAAKVYKALFLNRI